MDGALKYLDPWGRSAYANSFDWGAYGLGWHPGPSDAGEPALVADEPSLYGYRMTDRHIYRFLRSRVDGQRAMLSTSLPGRRSSTTSSAGAALGRR